MRTGFLSVFVTLVTFAAVGAHAQTKVLGEFPMCEASAALRLPCGEGYCLFVGDNEVRDRLYRFPIKNEDLEAQGGNELLLRDVEISDIESLVHLGSNRILVLGSHSRNKRCEPKKKRRRFLVITLSEGGIKCVGQTIQGKKITCKRLLGDAGDENSILKAVCNSIDDAEEKANSVAGALHEHATKKEKAVAKDACGKVAPFNIEGAVAISGADGPEVWVGLRGPLVEVEEDGETRRLAVMLRMKNKNQEELSFDAAALVDLGGFAIRELTVAGDWVWGIGGPPEDSIVDFKLWRFPIRTLEPNTTIQPQSLGKLPTSSEGLAVSGSTAFVVIDGDRSDNSCDKPATYRVIRVSN